MQFNSASAPAFLQGMVNIQCYKCPNFGHLAKDFLEHMNNLIVNADTFSNLEVVDYRSMISLV